MKESFSLFYSILLVFIDILMLVTVEIKFVRKYWKQKNKLPLPH